MTKQEFEDIALKYHADPKSIGCHWDGEKYTYFSLKHGNNQLICNREFHEPVWEVVISVGHSVVTVFEREDRLPSYIVSILKAWDNKNDR